MRELNEQEQFWAGAFGNDYIARNSLERLAGPTIAMWSRILRHCSSLPMSAFELGCNIGVNLYALAKYMHPYYQGFGYAARLCPVAEEAYRKILTFPLWVGMVKNDVERVV